MIQIQGKIPVDEVNDVGEERARAGLRAARRERRLRQPSVGPTFGAQVARSAVIAIIFSLLVISAYVAIRFEAKYAIPVLIALFHDILITGGVYSLTGREVTSGTVAAFLTILGYSMYDTVIVFDRIRENVPRMPRAAFSQIVNRSMSEVLTRSLITGLSTVFLITVLLIFGGATLQDFAFAMMVGILSGTYSSIFIASPVLTDWKEREPAYRARRGRLIEEMGYVPAFPEDNVVAKLGPTASRRRPRRAPRARRAGRRRRRARPAEPSRRAEPVEPAAATSRPAGDGAEAAGRGAPSPSRWSTGAPGEPAARRPRDRAPAQAPPAAPAPQAREESLDGGARLVHDGHRALALHGVRARPLLGRDRRRLLGAVAGAMVTGRDRPDRLRAEHRRDRHRHRAGRGPGDPDRPRGRSTRSASAEEARSLSPFGTAELPG